MVLKKDIPDNELIILLSHRLKNATTASYSLCDEIATFLIKSRQVTAESMFSIDLDETQGGEHES